MLNINSIELSDYHVWKKVKFDLLSGITLLTGQNGTGKSLLFSALTNAVWGGQANKRGSSANKQPAKSSMTLDISVSAAKFKPSALTPSANQPLPAPTEPLTHFRLTSTANAQRLLIDGEDASVKGKGAVRETFSNAFPIPKALYDATVHVRGKGGDPLSSGTPASRAEWLSDALGITQQYDYFHAMASDRLIEAERAKTQLDNALEQQKALTWVKETKPSKHFKKRLNESKQAISHLRSEIEIQEKIQVVLSYLDKGDTKDTLTKNRNAAAEECKRLEVQFRKHLQYAETQKHMARALTAKAEFLAEQESIVKAAHEDGIAFDPSNVKAERRILRGLEKMLAVWEPQIYKPIVERVTAWVHESKVRNALAAVFDQLSEDQKEFCKKPNALELANKRTYQLKARLNQLKEMLDLLKRHESGGRKEGGPPCCPLCQSKLKGGSLIETFTTERKKINDRLRQLDIAKTYLEGYARLTVKALPDTRAEADVDGAFYESLLPRRQWFAIQDKVESVDAYIKEHEVEKVDPIDEAYFKKQHKIVKTCDFKLTALKGLDDVGGETFTKKQLKQAKLELESLVDKQQKLQTKFTQATVNETLNERADQENEKLKAVIAKVKDASKKVTLFTSLKQVFGKTGLRQRQLKQTVATLEGEVNAMTGYMWDREIKFAFTVDDNGGLTVNATRNGVEADLMSLSGAEDKVWRIIFTLALIKILPPHYRSDTIILDELESNMSAETSARFFQNMLPEFRKYVDKVIVVTPIKPSQLKLVPDHLYQIKHVKGKSTLEKLA
jgi:DNA repair exonuclease SbcCD ATPase subunit